MSRSTKASPSMRSSQLMLGSSSPPNTAALEALTTSAGISPQDWGEGLTTVGLVCSCAPSPSTAGSGKSGPFLRALQDS
eukprot:13858217-Heterocapsa_arctica.AAC.1